MSYHEKRSIANILSTILIMTVYGVIIWQRFQALDLESANIFSFWGSAFLILIPITIAAKIVITILFTIFYNITTREEPPEITDERDKLIELKAGRNGNYFFIIGFIFAMVTQVIGWSPTAMFVTIAISGAVSEIAGELFQLRYYRRGV